MTTITVSKNELLVRMQTVGKIISPKPALPIMSYFLCETKEGFLHISATDALGRINTSMECSADKDVRICIESKKIIEALKELPEQPVKLEINEENYGIRITYLGGRFEMIGNDPALFPEPRSIDEQISFEIESDLFVRGVSDTLFCAAEDELRPILNGVYIETDSTGINFVATDGHRMAVIHNTVASLPRQSFVLPTKVAHILKGFNKKIDGVMSIMAGTRYVEFDTGDYQITALLQEGKYPNYRSVIPENDKKLIIHTSSLKNAISRVSLFSNPVSLLVVLSLSHDTILVKAQDIDYSSHAQETITCEYGDNNLEIGMKSTFMQEILSHMDSEQALLTFSEPSRAMLICPAHQSEGESRMFLQMPLSINY